MTKGRVIVAMSGGVDSSVAALLLKQQGYDVVGVTMRLWTVERENVPEHSKRCCSVEDVEDARRVCQSIGARHYVLNLEREFQNHVVDYFCREYNRGRTPHPCLACNDKIKFDFLLQRAMSLDADHIATGHYARIQKNGSSLNLLKGIDQDKDQSYVLFTLTQTEMSRLMLPIGNYPKSRIRELAAEADLPVAHKPDSQEICFIPDGDYRKFIGERTVSHPGNIVDTCGNVLGQHIGIHLFTVGQRRGIGLPGNTDQPMYVVKILPESNTVVLGNKEDLLSNRLWVSRLNFPSCDPPKGPIDITAKIRYKASEAPAILSTTYINPPLNGHSTAANDRKTNLWGELHFREPQRAITPGQAVVFYQGDQVFGGGIIELQPPDLTD